MNRIIDKKIYQNNVPYGHIELVCKLVTYYINVYLFGISVPVETIKTDSYNYALNKFTIMENKYNS